MNTPDTRRNKAIKEERERERDREQEREGESERGEISQHRKKEEKQKNE